jgi:hypothetical protein
MLEDALRFRPPIERSESGSGTGGTDSVCALRLQAVQYISFHLDRSSFQLTLLGSLVLPGTPSTTMSSNPDSKHDAVHQDNIDSTLNEKTIHNQPAILSDKDLMNNAYEAENREHEMGLWEAVKDHPMACFWAFVFCFTIVST